MKICGLILLLFLFNSTFAQQDKFTISGKIRGLESSKMFLVITDDSYKNGFKRDSLLVENGSFFYEGFVNKLVSVSINPNMERVVKRVPGGGYYPVKSSAIQLFVFPGANIKISGNISDFVNAYPKGDDANNDLATLNKAIFPLLNQSVNISVKIANKTVTDSLIIKKMKDTASRIDKQVISIKEGFIRNNQSSVAAIWLLSDMMLRSQLSNDLATELFSRMDSKRLSNLTFFQDVAKRVDGFSLTAKGKIVPDIISSSTYSGSKFELKALRGKYVILDFWGTWCGPCLSGMPRMKEYSTKYASRLELVGIASESDKGEKWKKFLDNNPQYRWHQLLSTSENDLILRFSVAGFPTKILIDQEGKIIDRFVGEDEEIYKKLDELLK